MNQSLHGGAVGLHALKVFLESRVAGTVSISLQAQHVTKQLHRFRAHPGKQLVLLFGQCALHHLALRVVRLHLAGHLVGLSSALKHAEIDPLAALVHHIHGVLPKTHQRGVALIHQLHRLFSFVQHAVAGIGQHLRAGRVHISLLQKVIAQNLGGHAGVIGGQGAVANRLYVLAAKTHHVRDGQVAQALVHRLAELAVQLGLLVVQAKHLLQLPVAEHRTRLEHFLGVLVFHHGCVLVQGQALPHAQHLGVQQIPANHLLRLGLGVQLGGTRLQHIHLDRSAGGWVAPPDQRTLENRPRNRFAVFRGNRLLAHIAQGFHGRQNAGRQVGCFSGVERNVI